MLCPMTPEMLAIRDIEARLKGAGHSVAHVCRAAGMDRVTWHRWKKGDARPSDACWEAVRGVLRPLIGEVPASLRNQQA